jgi:spore coat polysaccharide biosynthesis predicted glycosyltransferase SpsG
LKECLVISPILVFSNFDKQFILFTDASNKRNQKYIIIYANQTFSKAEKNYAMTKLDVYIYGQRFKLIIDYLVKMLPET